MGKLGPGKGIRAAKCRWKEYGKVNGGVGDMEKEKGNSISEGNGQIMDKWGEGNA